MLIDERNEDPIYIKFLLHHGPDQGRVGVLADSMFAIIIGFDVKGHRETSPLVVIWGSGLSLAKIQSVCKPDCEKLRQNPLWALDNPIRIYINTFQLFVKITNSLT